MTVHRSVTLATIMAAVVLAGGAARAQRPATSSGANPAGLDEARREQDEARRLFDEARRHLERANALRVDPRVILALADAHEAAGDVPAAITALEQYIAATPGGPDRAVVDLRLQNLRARRATLVIVTAPSGARVVIDGTDTHQVTPATIELPPGAHRVRLERADRVTRDVELELAPGVRRELSADLPEALAPPPPRGPASTLDPRVAVDRRERPLGPGVWIASGVAGVLLVQGLGFGLVALTSAIPMSEPNRSIALEARARTEFVAEISLAGFVVVGTVALVEILTHRARADRSPPPARAALGVRIHASGGGLGFAF